jgi:hypothetical protein
LPDAVNSSALYRPHPPTADPFADTWYAYLNDPDVGLLKVVFLSYLNDRTEDGHQHAYVHVAHAPVDGPSREWDHWFRDVVSKPVESRGPEAFRFEVPGFVSIDEATMALTLPEVAVRAEWAGPHHPYFPEPDPAASPFMGPMPALPSDESHWFVHTLGTPTTYRFTDGRGETAGRGLMYAERGWSVRQAHGFCYVMAVSEPAKVVMTCGMPDDDHEVWAGRVVTDEHDLTFLPFAGDHVVTSRLDPGEGRAEVTITRDDLAVRVRAEAPLTAFYDQITPSLTVFGADHPVAKTMRAGLTLEILRDGHVVETVALPQAILEFGGVLYPTELEVLTLAERPVYRYEA